MHGRKRPVCGEQMKRSQAVGADGHHVGKGRRVWALGIPVITLDSASGGDGSSGGGESSGGGVASTDGKEVLAMGVASTQDDGVEVPT